MALDITDRVLGQDEQGLLGLALHPDWPDDPRAYVHYSSREGDGDTVLSEFRVTDDPLPPRLDPTTERVLLTVDQPYANHNGGQLAFGPDGFLYMGLGDGGSGGDPHGNGQNPDVLLGKILRIDVDGDEGYAIPPENPFADGGGAPEVLLIGLRNPWRFSFDRDTGLLWIGDVGQERGRGDRPHRPRGRCRRQPRLERDGGVAMLLGGRTAPPMGSPSRWPSTAHDLGCSVTGGYVYRGEAIADLRGWYLFSDYCTGTLFGIPSDAEGVIGPRIAARPRLQRQHASARVPTASSTSPTSAVARSTGSSPATDRASRARAGSSIDRGR